jgi:Ca2+-binding RTX toxin-like protein
MHHFRSIRRVALGAAVVGAAIGAVPALANASSTCVYHHNIKEVNVTDGSGAQPLRIVRESTVSPFITLDDGVGTKIFCPGAGGTFAQIDNTDQIDISGPITNTLDGYVIDESGGRLGPGATLEPTGGSEIEVVAFTDGGVRGSLHVRGGEGPDTYKVGGTGNVDMGGDGDSDFSITAGANEVKLVGAEGADTLTGSGFGSTGPAGVRVVLDGGANDDTLVGGNAGDQFLGGSGADTLRAVDNRLDVISGGPDFDVANVDRFSDVFIDGVERINKISGTAATRPSA